MNIIISAILYPVASGRYMADAFRRLGYDVRTLGMSTGGQIWGGELDAKYAWQSDGDLTKSWPDWTPDLIVHMDSSFAYHHPVYADVPHVVYGMDNHVRDYLQAGVSRYFLAHKAISVRPFEHYSAQGFVEHLPCAYDPVWFTPSPIPWNDREYDVCMIGVLYPERVELLNALANAGLKVLAGTGWVYDQYRAAYHNSRISLCKSANGDVAQRVFETAAMGCAVLTDRLADLENEETNKALGLQGFFVYMDVAECVQQATALIREEQARAQVGAAMMQKSVVGKHSWDARAARIVEWYQETYDNDNIRNEVTPEENSLSIIHNDYSDGIQIRPDEHNRNTSTIEAPASLEVVDAEIHMPAEIDDLPEPEKPTRKKRGH